MIPYEPIMADSRKDLWQHLPTHAGVYLFKDNQGQILYVGKAKNLKKRVASYFAKQLTDRPWTAIMIELIADVETIVVDNELEALMLEATLIKQHLPRFNIKLTDDKSYPYIKLALEEPIPRFTVTRRQDADRATYFGPYLSGRAAQHTLEFLRQLYGIHLSPRPLKHRDRPCLNCQLDGFTCPLADEVDPEKYRERVEATVSFLQGKRKTLIDDLRDRMNEAAERNHFELAAKLRDRLHSVQQVIERQQVISTALDDYDVIGGAQSSTVAAIVILHIREGRVSGQNSFFFDFADGETQSDVIRQFLITIYPNFSQFPQLISVHEPLQDQEVIERFLCTLSGQAIELRAAVRGEKRKLVDLAIKNARAKLESRLLRSGNAYQALISLKELLKIDELPERIEAVDISNLGTSEPVGATICFINGKPDKNEYRRYKIRYGRNDSKLADNNGRNIRRTPNDFAMIGEVVKRRFSDTNRPLPDLLIIDGGAEQLKSALEALKTTPLKPKRIISLAKKPDRIFVPDRKLPWPSSRGHKGLLLLARIRDEVHRFAIGFQRNRQRKRSLLSSE